MNNFQNRHIQNLFNISAPTVRTWSDEFSDYLSPSANPPANKTRYFTDTDIQVFATIARLRDERRTTDEIKEHLDRGILDNLPVELPKDLLSIVSSDAGLQLVREIETMKQEIDKLKNDDEKIRLAEEVKQLNREIGRLELLLEQERTKKDE